MKFWEGCELNVHSYAAKKVVCCMLLCCACDLPAGRKACGFLGHSAKLGCSCCLKKFSGSVGSMDYSGFDRDQWIPRNGTDHRKHSLSLLKCCTKSQLEHEESKHGCRYSVLIKLPYFNALRFLVVDPMHNLFLGTAKHFLKAVWLESGVISQAQFQHCVDLATVPSGIG